MNIEEIIQKATMPDGTIDMNVISFHTSSSKSNFMFNHITSVLARRGATIQMNLEMGSEEIEERYKNIFQSQ